MTLKGKTLFISGASRGIGLAIALRAARDGANIVVAAKTTEPHPRLPGTIHTAAEEIEKAGGKALPIALDIRDDAAVQQAARQAAEAFGGIDVLVNNAAFQMTHETLDEISDDEWDHTLATNLTAMFILCKDAVPHMQPGSSIINTSSVNSDMPKPTLAPYATTKAGIANFTASLAQMLGEKGIRANSVAPGPVWTPLIPSTMPAEDVASFGQQVPLGRAGQPAELAPVYVLLASDEASYVSGARVAVTGGNPIL
jgi:NAD(P)-dependent dehydrogenase (short-subunit alcohol dehydrogenase family)